MGKKTRKKIMAGILCLIILLLTGCSGKKEESDTRSSLQSGEQTEEAAGENTEQTEEAAGENTEKTEDVTGEDGSRSNEKELRQAAAPQFIPNSIRSVSLKKDGQEFLHISKEPAEYKMSFDYWEILNPYDENATMDTEVMFEMFEELCSLRFTETVTTEEGMDTGIQDSDMGITVEYVDTTDDSQAKSVNSADTRAEIILGKEDGNGGRYAVTSNNKDEVFVLPEETLRMIYARKPFDYILKIPVLISADTVEAVELSADGEKYEIGLDTAKDSYRFGKKKVKKEEFAALYQALSEIKLVSEMEQEENGGKEDPRLSVIYRRNTGDAPDVRVSYYFYDAEFDSVEIDGKERFLVRKEEVETVIEQIKKLF